MKKWAIAAVIYLAAVIGGYQVYAQFFQNEKEAAHSSAGNHESAEHGHGEKSAHGHEGSHEASESEVNVNVEYKDSVIDITLRDKQGNPVNDFEINHEKLMHLIVVSDDLEEYYHLHPKKTGEGIFQVEHKLADGSYKVFVDIKPKHLNYSVMPSEIKVGESNTSHEHGLTPDKVYKKTVEGETVEMKMSSQKASVPIELSFELDKNRLEPYLGAMGHVVILDEKAEHYLHVHPLKQDEPVFETQFDQPGTYKIWAEFKQDGKVRAFPFVVEIK